ncbi:hypothetical protein [Aureimonas glaciei]|uniref:Uncharacterized protein n=1 Tax=Aureimonas glaciei TaxID=1776957 RepID=A0A916YGC5_9HYPH|nr:hypothetical protein [Aureimonas glaciei]GGD43364.1 hypothetical protein GCM10011335_52510 [Aureimonas glaciei]
MDIAGSLAAVGSALTIVKELRAVDAQMDQATMKLKVAELTSALADAKLGLVDVADQLREKDAEISKLRDALRYREDNLISVNGLRYHTKGVHAVGAPICPVCEAKGLFLTVVRDVSSPGHPFKCPSCKANFGNATVFRSAV